MKFYSGVGLGGLLLVVGLILTVATALPLPSENGVISSSKPSLNTLDTRADIAARAKGNNEGNQEEQSKLKKMATSLKSIVGKSEEQIRKDQEEDQKQQEYWRKRLAKQKEDEELHLKELARQKAELEKMLDRVSNPQDGQSGT